MKRGNQARRFVAPIFTIAAVFVAVLLAGLSTASAQSLDNQGTEFLMGYMPNNGGSGTVEVHLAADTATSVTIEYPVGTTIATEAVTPGTVSIVTIPTGAQNWSPNTSAANLVRASADDEFVAYMVNRQNFTSDAALALPVDTFNTEYIVMDYNPRFRGAQFLVTAAFDNTTVTITPKTALVGRPAGVPFDVTLNSGEGYFGQSASTAAANTLTGTIISADRPVGLTNGDGCTQVPTGTTFCDHIFEVAQPVQTWGTEVGVVNLPQRTNGSIYRIVASEDNTSVTQDGTALTTLNRGDFFETAALTGNHVFRADKPIYVGQFMTGNSTPGADDGDPAQGNMIPFAQYVNDYTFSTVGGSQFATHFVTIIANNSDVGSLELDGTAVPAASYTPIPTTGFSAATVEILEGTHSTSSNSPHGITIEGYNQDDSYLYPGGALFQFINPVGDANPPLIGVSLPTGTPPTVNGTTTDQRPTEDTNGNGILDPGEDLNGNGQIDTDTGVFFVQLGAGSSNLALTVDPFTPGDGSVDFSVTLIDDTMDGTGTVDVTDGAGNVASVPISILVAPTNQPPTVTITDPADGDVVDEGVQVDLSATISDPDVGDTHTCSIDWGDGTVSAGTVAGDICTGSHTYGAPGSPTITVTATDDGGLSGDDSIGLTVNSVGANPCDGSYSVGWDNDVLTRNGHRQTVKVAMSIPDGTYDLKLVSYDPDHAPGVDVDQDTEQWQLEIFRVKPGKSDKRVYRSPAIDDLAEADTMLSQIVDTGIELDYGGSYKVRARHTAKSGSHSIIPLCAVLEPSTP